MITGNLNKISIKMLIDFKLTFSKTVELIHQGQQS